MWEAFGGYAAIYGRLPPARTVRRVRLYLAAVAEREEEQAKETQARQAEQEADLQRRLQQVRGR